MFRFIETRPVGGDCICGYRLELDKEYTVASFIETVLKERSNEWGYIGIDKKGAWLGEPNCEYRRGKLMTKQLDEEYLNKKILEVRADGGWSRMDYIITCY